MTQGVCLSVCLSGMQVGCFDAAERINVLFGVETKIHCARWAAIPTRGFDAAFATLLGQLLLLLCVCRRAVRLS